MCIGQIDSQVGLFTPPSPHLDINWLSVFTGEKTTFVDLLQVYAQFLPTRIFWVVDDNMTQYVLLYLTKTNLKAIQ